MNANAHPLEAVRHLLPSITEMREELRKAGWKERHATIYVAPDGRYFRGPALAYAILKRLI